VNCTVLFFGVAGQLADMVSLGQPRGELLIQVGGRGQPERSHHVRGDSVSMRTKRGLPIRLARTAKNLSSDAAGQGLPRGTRSSRPAPAAGLWAEPACRGVSALSRAVYFWSVPGGCTLSRMTTESSPPGQGGPADPAAALADRLFHDVIGALELFTVYLGERLGLYGAMARDGPATSAELAGRTGTAERYVRE
jgi:hypothetical protein